MRTTPVSESNPQTSFGRSILSAAARLRWRAAAARDRARVHRQEGRTSLSDDGRYLSVCAAAATDPLVFASFRRSRAYVRILEHTTHDQGAEYFRIIARDSPHLLEEIDRFRANDNFGGPRLSNYPEVGRISPSTLRYVKVLSDLERMFGHLTGADVVEIGVGYGGQCRIITSHWAVRSYTLIDLDPVLDLARAYLSRFETKTRLTFASPSSVEPGTYDLCLSNYAFTELTREVQRDYARRVVAGSRSGYMTCNFISAAFGLDSFDRSELVRIHSGTSWVPEEPRTHFDNAILVWGRSDAP